MLDAIATSDARTLRLRAIKEWMQILKATTATHKHTETTTTHCQKDQRSKDRIVTSFALLLSYCFIMAHILTEVQGQSSGCRQAGVCKNAIRVSFGFRQLIVSFLFLVLLLPQALKSMLSPFAVLS